MKVHVFQHVPFEDIGSMRPWLTERGADITYTRFFAGDAVPALAGVDLLIVMGGPMSVNDEAELPWLIAEKRAVREAVGRELPVLGICLGAQLIASALGARVYRNPVKEIGWHPIRGVDGGPAAYRFPAECPVFHWHGETFDLPSGSMRLAESVACANQAFQIGRHVIGLQFHLETTPESAGQLLDQCRDELIEAPYIQREEAMRAAPAARYQAINRLMGEVLGYLLPAAGRPSLPSL
jgi:GMP synthase-like glutamine amidotransferase